MKILSVFPIILLFVLNVVALVWMQMLPDDSEISRRLLAHVMRGDE